jgi:hypothetical protein
MTRRQTLAVVLGLAALVAGLHARVLLAEMSFALRDHLVLNLPLRTALRDALLSGRIPQWWDGVGLGVPFAANPVHQVWAPVTWLCALIPMPLGADIEPLAYLFMAAVGTALLSSRLGAGALGAFLAGAVVATCGYFNSLIVNGNLPHVAWLGWMAWAAVRVADAVAAGERPLGAAALLGGFAALQLVGGEPAAVVSGVLLVLALTATRGWSVRTFGWLAGAGVGGVALAAVQLVPAALLVGTTDRGGGFDLATASDWSLHPVRLLELLWPRLAGDPVRPHLGLGRLLAGAGAPGQEPSWSYSVFVGAPVLVLAIAGARGRLRWLLLAISGFLLLALGSHTPAFELLRAIFPPERYARFPEKHVVGALILAAALAGVGLAELSSRPCRWSAVFAGVGAVLGVAVIGVAVARTGLTGWLVARASEAGASGLEAGPALGVSIRWGGIAALALVACAAGALVIGRPRARLAGELLVIAAIAMPAAGDVLAFTKLIPRGEVTDPPALLRVPPDDGAPPPRLYRPRFTSAAPSSPEALPRVFFETAALNTASRFGFQVLPGQDVALDRDHVSFWDQAHRQLSPWELGVLFGVRWVMVDDFSALPPYPGPVAARGHRLTVVDLSAAIRPRAFVTSRWVPVSSRQEALAMLASPGRARDPALVMVERAGADAAPVRPVDAGPARACIVQRQSPEQVELLCDSAADGHAVLLDAHSAGWSATVDGEPGPVLRADGFFRAVPVRAGVHRIRFSYSAPGFPLGAWISGLALVLAIAIGVGAAVRRPSPRPG